MTKILSASRLNDYLGCAHQSALWLSDAKPDEETDATLELVRAKGFAHEALVLAKLERQYGPAVRIPDKGRLEDRQAATLQAIKEGAPLIYQGAFSNSRWIGFPDFLVRKATSSDGGVSYEPEDAKLARKAEAEHLLQLGVYAELLQELAGSPVGGGKIHVAGAAPETFDLRSTHAILMRFMRGFEAFVADAARNTRPLPCAACSQCDFKGKCEQEWRDADSPFFVAGLSGAQLVKLEAGGITTLAGLAKLPAKAKIDGIGSEPLARLAAQARMQLSAREKGVHATELLPIAKGRGFGLLPPPAHGDLYFDMEGDPLFDGGLEYLFGIWGNLGEAGTDAFVPIWAHDRQQEKEAFEQLMQLFADHFARHPAAHVYHYAQYEPAALKRLAMRHATMEAELDQMLRDRRFVDLYRVVRQGLRASTEGYSLKDLEKIYWDTRGGEVTTAADSIVEYERWCVSHEEAILDSIAAYNKHDCVSTAHMHSWLEKMRPAGTVFSIADEDDDDGKAIRSAEREALQARKIDLARRVRSSSQGDAQVRDLVAELLWFHQRAQKPGWWAVFERQAWSDEELTDDAECIGGVARDSKVAPIPVKRSLDTTYRFGPQDTKLKIGDRPKIAATRAPAGVVVEIDPEDGHVVLRRGSGAPPLPDRFGLIPAPIDQQGLPVAVMKFAERFDGGDLRGDRALMDILMRRPPRLKGRASGEPVLNQGEDLVAGTVRAALDLDHSALFVQGPPGTGKTYTIAATIVVLLHKGYRVGVTSNSHKVVHKVLEEVEKHAAKSGLHFTGAKKATKDNAETEFASAHISTVYRSEDVARTHRLVGGTTFHFCRDDQQNAFDFLIVDEAGQVALGNLVAVAGSAKNIILVGDQMQLPQPVQGVHPGETGLSSLEYRLQGRATVQPEHGILLNESWRMHPSLCRFISDAIYDGRLTNRPHTAKRSLILAAGAYPALASAGLAMLKLEHEGFTQSNSREADAIVGIIDSLLKQNAQLEDGTVRKLTIDDILVVAPYNMQVNLLRQRLPSGVRVGTVDKFQGQEALAVIVSMTTSRGDEAPRGTEFLFNPNRLNVALSRAQCLAIVVAGKGLLDGQWKGIGDLRRVNLVAHAESVARITIE